MRKFLILCLIFFGLLSCKQKIVREVSVEIIFDHEIDPKLSQNDSLYTFLKPTNFSDTFLNIVPLFKKIDSDQFIEDSIQSNDGVISELQNWISQGKKNPTFFIKKRTKQIENAVINSGFSVKGDRKYVDSFYAKNKTQYVIYSKHKYDSLHSELNSRGIKVFHSIISLKSFLFSIKDSLTSKKAKLNIIFDPELSIIPASPIAIKTSAENPIVASIDNIKESNLKVIENQVSLPEEKKPSSISPEECDRRIEVCLNKPQNEEKVIFFFDEIFRFVKTGECRNTSYKKLIVDIYNILSTLTPPRFNKNISNTYFSLVCSNKTDFGDELEKVGVTLNKLNYSKIFDNCPE